MRNISPTVKILIIVNVALLLLTSLLDRLGLDLTRYLALYFPASEYFFPHQFVTHLFMHGGWAHLFFNMYALFVFGTVLERVWGQKRFLVYYLVTGLGAAALHTLVNWFEISKIQEAAAGVINTLTPDTFSAFVSEYFSEKVNIDAIDAFVSQWETAGSSPLFLAQAEEVINNLTNSAMNVPTVGASGAIFGVLLAFGMLFPNTQLMLLFPPMPIKAKWMVIGYGVLELALGFYNPGSNVAHFAHVGGMIFGFFLIRYWQKSTGSFY
ncbi:MAG: rhomboid family intramembrane serine protease [Prevotellaceae bacterium]|jgi:membrane associated rhomboid family serine protease|nr:rhomboid family intramembrane serine protease [Prevotellaceae bacterium]